MFAEARLSMPRNASALRRGDATRHRATAQEQRKPVCERPHEPSRGEKRWRRGCSELGGNTADRGHISAHHGDPDTSAAPARFYSDNSGMSARSKYLAHQRVRPAHSRRIGEVPSAESHGVTSGSPGRYRSACGRGDIEAPSPVSRLGHIPTCASHPPVSGGPHCDTGPEHIELLSTTTVFGPMSTPTGRRRAQSPTEAPKRVRARRTRRPDAMARTKSLDMEGTELGSRSRHRAANHANGPDNDQVGNRGRPQPGGRRLGPSGSAPGGRAERTWTMSRCRQ